MYFFDFLQDLEIWNGNWADFSDLEDVYNGIMVVICVTCAGLAAGLTVGLLSLDLTKLEIKLMIGTDEEKSAANQVLPIVKQHHLLLVTLLLFNSIANETLPIFLGSLVPNYIAVLLSVTLVLIFGEIIPSALFTGPNQLITAAALSKLVYFLLLLFYPIAYPISLLLDYLFGQEDDSGSMSRDELEALVLLQGEKRQELYAAQHQHHHHHHHHHNQVVNADTDEESANLIASTHVTTGRKTYYETFKTFVSSDSSHLHVTPKPSPTTSPEIPRKLPIPPTANNGHGKGGDVIIRSTPPRAGGPKNPKGNNNNKNNNDHKTSPPLPFPQSYQNPTNNNPSHPHHPQHAHSLPVPLPSSSTPSSTSSSAHHQHPTSVKHEESSSLTKSEISLMTGILKLSKVTVKDTMIPIKGVSMISSSTRLNEKSLYDILDCGFSRLPVYERTDRQHVLGYLLVKELIVVSKCSSFCFFLLFSFSFWILFNCFFFIC
jgi:hypothetical protein